MYNNLLDSLEIPNYAPDYLLTITMQYLQRGGPREWHDVAQSWNWGLGWLPLKWIVDQDDADQATIQTLFWYAEPEYTMLYEPLIGSTDPNFLFPLYILARWKSGVYLRSEFCFPGVDDGGPENEQFIRLNLQAQQRSLHFPGLEIPMSMVVARQGVAVPKKCETFLVSQPE